MDADYMLVRCDALKAVCDELKEIKAGLKAVQEAVAKPPQSQMTPEIKAQSLSQATEEKTHPQRVPPRMRVLRSKRMPVFHQMSESVSAVPSEDNTESFTVRLVE